MKGTMGGARDAPWRLIGLCRTTHLVGAKRLGIVFRHARELRAVGDAEVGAVIARFGKHQNRAARLAVQRLDPLAPALSRLAHLAASGSADLQAVARVVLLVVGGAALIEVGAGHLGWRRRGCR